jgi:uncharacterized protein (TIGR02611 family)
MTEDMDTDSRRKTATTEADRPNEPALVRKLREKRETHKEEHGPIYRAAFVIAGIVLTLGGIAMLVLPGPAFIVIPIGLAILSLEFGWAGALLDRSLEQAAAAQRKAAETSTAQRVLTALAAACAAGAFAAWAIVGDVPILPV